MATKRAAAEKAGIPSSVSAWATVNPSKLGENSEPYSVSNVVNGKSSSAAKHMSIIHPLDKSKHDIFTIPDTQVNELEPFIQSLRKVPKTGVHNPLKNNDRYLKLGEISRKVCTAPWLILDFVASFVPFRACLMYESFGPVFFSQKYFTLFSTSAGWWSPVQAGSGRVFHTVYHQVCPQEPRTGFGRGTSA